MGASHNKDGLFALFYNPGKGFYSKCCDSLDEIKICKDGSEEKWSWKGLGYHDIGKSTRYPPMVKSGILIIGVYNRNDDSQLTQMANDIENISNGRRGIGSCLTIAHDF